jgi:hypothetical protein
VKAHTHGPWDYCGYEVMDGKGATICNMSGYRPENATKANARLIAAAPDLLEACIGLCHDDLTCEQFSARLAFAQATIAKARGEA